MDVSAVGTNTAAVMPQTDKQPSKADSDQQIKKLEHQKEQLSQKLEDARNPFAIDQSDEYQQLQKKLAEKEEELAEAQTKKRTEETKSVKEVSAIDNKVNDQDKIIDNIKSERNYDTFTHEQKSSSAGVYQITRDVNGQRVINYENYEAQYLAMA